MLSMAISACLAGTLLAEPHYERGMLGTSQAGPAAWSPVTFAKPFPAAPVVVLGPASSNDPEPATVRVRYVTATGFEFQIDEWDYLDGAHGAEKIGFLALEPGVHQIGGRPFEAGRIAGVANEGARLRLKGVFPRDVVLLTQVETAVNRQALTARVHPLKPLVYDVRVQTQESVRRAVAGETVGYIAVGVGTGEMNGAPFRAARRGNSVTNGWKQLDFQGQYVAPIFLAGMQTRNNEDPAVLRYRNLGEAGVEIAVKEERSSDRETRHPPENVGYLVIAQATGEEQAKLEIGALVQAQPDSATWHSVAFDKPYARPVVVMGPPSSADARPVDVRVRNVTSAGFEYQLDDWGLGGTLHAPETISYLVMEEGVYQLGGLRWQARRAAGVTSSPGLQSFPEAFSSPPVVLAQVATTNDTSSVTERVSNVTTAGFTLELDEAEADDGIHLAEEVHYVAIESGKARFVSNQILFEVAATTAAVHSEFARIDFSTNFVAPFFLADMQTRNDADPAALRQRRLTFQGVDLKVEEETSANPETVHGNEVVGFLVVAGAIDTDEDGLPDEWELANGLDPNNPADALGDSDDDGFSALEEFGFGTNPNAVDRGGTVTAVVTVPDAFEQEAAPARIRVERTGGVVPITVPFSLSGPATHPGQLGADFQTRSADGAVLTGSVEIPFNASFVEVLVEPVADGVPEYPELATVTLQPGAKYTLGAAVAGSVTIADATDIRENELLFVAFLTAQDSAQTFASGIATLHLNGPKTRARVNLSFSGLTSNQTNAYLRYGVPNGVGPELRPTLPIGQVVNEPWNIVPVGDLTEQEIIDALFQDAGQFVYVNIGTGNYPAGEIRGTLTRQTGSTTFTPPAPPPALEPLSEDDLRRDVARFLTQATFGPRRDAIDALVSAITTKHAGHRIAGFSAWIDAQLALDQTRLSDYTLAADAEEWVLRGADPVFHAEGNEPYHTNRRRGWWMLAVKAHDQLRQRMAFALSEIFVISERESFVRSRHYGAAIYYDTLAGFAGGRYRALLGAVSRSPMMGKYLSHLKNQKALVDPTTGHVLISPDENYAREVMQLFSIGLVHRHPDGTLKLGTDGLPMATYDNNDITDLARVLTGWSFSKRHNLAAEGYPIEDNPDFHQGAGAQYYQASWMHPMKNFPTFHDTGAKTVLGVNIPAGLTGAADLDAALDILANHPNTPAFISRLLIQRLVTSNPSAGYLHRVAQKFQDNGEGVRGDLKAVLKAILLDYEARSLEVTKNIGYGKQKEPIIRYAQLLRAFDAASSIPLSRLSQYGYPASQLDNFPSGVTQLRLPNTERRLGQAPLRAPSVFNWFLPDFNPGGAIASAGLVAPEMQLTSETTVVEAVNYHQAIVFNGNGQNADELPGATDHLEDNIRIMRGPLVALYDAEIAAGKTVREAVSAVVDYLDRLLLAGNLKVQYGAANSPNPRSIIIDSLAGMTVANTGALAREALYLVVTSPEYIHQK